MKLLSPETLPIIFSLTYKKTVITLEISRALETLFKEPETKTKYNKRYSYHSENYKGFRNSASNWQQRSVIYFLLHHSWVHGPGLPNHSTHPPNYSACVKGWGQEIQTASIDILPRSLHAKRSSLFPPGFPSQHEESLELCVGMETMKKALSSRRGEANMGLGLGLEKERMMMT